MGVPPNSTPRKTNECPLENQWLVQMYFLLVLKLSLFRGHSLVFRDVVTFQIDRDHEIAGCLPCVTCFASGSGKNLGSRLAFLQKT